MDRDDPEQAADRHARAAVMAIFAVILAVAIMAAFITTLAVRTARKISSAEADDLPSDLIYFVATDNDKKL
jgi:hypothetical protein